MARELMPKSGILMPYVVITRDAAVVGVSTVDGVAGSVNLTNKYLQIGDASATYLSKSEGATKAYVNGLIQPVMEGALFKSDPYVNNNTPFRSGGGNGVQSVDLIKADANNAIAIGNLDANVQGVNIYSTGRLHVIDKNQGGVETAYPLYSSRYRPEIGELPFAAIGSYVKDAKGRTIGVNRTGINSDITQMTQKVTFTQSPTVPDAAQPYDAVNLRQLQAAGGGGGANMSGVMNNYIGAVEWFNGSRAKLPAGYIAADGQLVSRSDAKTADLWAAVSGGFLVGIPDADWLDATQGGTNPNAERWSNRGAYSFGNGSTDFRVPDLNGAAPDSIGGPFLRGDAAGRFPTILPGVGGVIAGAAPNIVGSFANPVGSMSGAWSPITNWNSAFSPVQENTTSEFPANSSVAIPGVSIGVKFDASRSNGSYGRKEIGGQAAEEVRPNSVVGIWIIRASGAFTSAHTNFSSINGDATLPPAGTVIEGGSLRSVYNVNGVEHMSASLTMRRGVGQRPFARLWLKSADLGEATTWDFPLNQQWNAFGTASTRNVTSWNHINLPTPADVMIQNSVDFRGITSYAVLSAYPMGVVSGLAKGSQGWGREEASIVGVLSSRNWPDMSGANSCFQIGCNEQIGLAYKKPQYAGAETYFSDAIVVRDTRNTTVDGSGFIKAASPIVKLFGDGSKELNEDSRGAKTERISEGVYRVTGVLGFNSDAAWSGIDGGYGIPKSGNELPLIWLDYEIEADGSIIVKTYHRTHPSAPAFARNEIEGYAEADPIDIPKGRWVDLRVQMPERKD